MSNSTHKQPSDSEVITITLNPNGNIGGSSIPYIEGKGFSVIRKHQKSFPIGNGKFRNWIPKENTKQFVSDMKKQAGITIKLVEMTNEAKEAYNAKWGKPKVKTTKAEREMAKKVTDVADFASHLTSEQKEQLRGMLGL